MNKFLKTVEVICLAALAADAILDIAALVREARSCSGDCARGHGCCGRGCRGHGATEEDFEPGY